MAEPKTVVVEGIAFEDYGWGWVQIEDDGDVLACEYPMPKILDALEARDEEIARLKADIQCMVDKAASKSLDGYRALGTRAAKAENERDDLRIEVAALRAEVAKLRECVEWYADADMFEPHERTGMSEIDDDAGDRARACLDAMKEKTDG